MELRKTPGTWFDSRSTWLARTEARRAALLAHWNSAATSQRHAPAPRQCYIFMKTHQQQQQGTREKYGTTSASVVIAIPCVSLFPVSVANDAT